VNAKKKDPSFGEAVGEVEEILSRLESDEIDVDELSGEVKRAVELVGLCREKLQRTELEVKEFVAKLEADDSADESGALPF
jgi:exodeoxyribonuclease VII small subunit